MYIIQKSKLCLLDFKIISLSNDDDLLKNTHPADKLSTKTPPLLLSLLFSIYLMASDGH